MSGDPQAEANSIWWPGRASEPTFDVTWQFLSVWDDPGSLLSTHSFPSHPQPPPRAQSLVLPGRLLPSAVLWSSGARALG